MEEISRRRPSVLFIDDDPDQLNMLGILLEQQDFVVDRLSCPLLALEQLRKISYDLVICDLRMPQMNGDEFLEKFRDASGPNTPVIIISAAFEALEDLDKIFMSSGNARYCRKENSSRTLVKAAKLSLARNNPQLTSSFV